MLLILFTYLLTYLFKAIQRIHVHDTETSHVPTLVKLSRDKKVHGFV